MITAHALAIAIGFLLDMIIGGRWLLNITDKFTMLIERLMRKIFPASKKGEIAGGTLTALIVIIISGAVPFAILFFAYRYNVVLAAIIEAVICCGMLSVRQAGKRAMKVYTPLMRGDIDTAGKNALKLTAQDTEKLDDAGITKAAVEAVAVNTCDGAVAPVLCMAVGGGVLVSIYRAVNIMASRGYNNDSYINFGRFASWLNRVLNYIPSKIAARIMILLSYILGFDGKNASYIHKRDARKNGGASVKSVMAGALRIQFESDAYYYGKLCKREKVGDPIRDAQYDNIPQSVRLMYVTAVIVLLICFGALAAVGYII